MWRELSLFTGAGGGLYGSKLLGWRTICAVEWNKYAQDVLRARQRDGWFDNFPIYDDVFQFDGTPWRGRVDVLSAGFPCFVAGTMVLTHDGYRTIETIEKGDMVLTHKGRWRKVNAVMRKENAPVRRIKAQGVDVVTTDEHPFYCRERGRKWDNDARSYLRTLGDARWVDAKNINKNEFVGQVLPKEQKCNLSDDALWLYGRYLADGWRVRRLNRPEGSGRVVICCAHKEADELRSRIKAAGYSGSEVVDGAVVKFHITNNELYQNLECFGHLAHGKKLPGWTLELCEKQARSLLDGYISGDGCYQKNPNGQGGFWRITTVSKSLAFGAALLAQRAYGVVASVRKHKTKNQKLIQGRLVNQRDMWFVSIPERNRSGIVEGSYGWKNVRSNVSCGYADVYNIGVEDDESYVADGAIVHNCQPFSVAGKELAGDDPRNGWPHTARIIREVGCPFVWLENVPGLISGSHGYFGTILGDLHALGFDAVWRVVSAASVGAPHERKRLWVLAFKRESLANPSSKGWCKQHIASISNRLGQPARGDFEKGRQGRPEPSVQRVVDGMAYRRNSTKALGNGQVPQQMVVAFRTLYNDAIRSL